MAYLIYHLIKYKEEYIEVDQLVFELKLRESRLKRLRKQAKELGFQLIENQQPV